MKNNEQQILNEIRTMMASIRQQMELLDAKMAELQQITRSEDEVVAPIVLDIDDLPFDLPVEESPAPAYQPEPEVIQVQVPEPVDEDPVVEEPVIEEQIVEEPVAESVVEDIPEEIVFVEPAVEELVVEEPVVETAPEPSKPAVKEAIIDAMTEKQAWRTDMPGTQVKDVRLAISLHERVLFINHLFAENPMVFQATVNKVNASQSLDEVVEYIKETFPQWDLDSDLVYRFMMAVRRKIR